MRNEGHPAVIQGFLAPPARQALACLALLVAAPSAGLALTLGPMRLQNSRGLVQIANSESRLIRLRLGLYGVLGAGPTRSPSLVPLPLAEAERLIRLRPTSFRLGPGQTRGVSYRVLSPSRPFYVCGVTPSGLFTLRVCSLWPGLDRASLSPSLPPRPRSI